jgi:hypothetical protein
MNSATVRLLGWMREEAAGRRLTVGRRPVTPTARRRPRLDRGGDRRRSRRGAIDPHRRHGGRRQGQPALLPAARLRALGSSAPPSRRSTGYEPGFRIDGIELCDRIWLGVQIDEVAA